MTNPTNLTPIMAECRAYVGAITDFEIETEGNTENTPDGIIQYISSENTKVLLTEFLLECEQAFEKSQLDLSQLLRKRKNHYQATQAKIIGGLNEQIDRTTKGERAKYEDKKDRFLTYFHHNYALIDLISARLTNSPLNEHLQFKLKHVGLDWIVDGTQHPTPEPEYSESDKGLSAAQKMLFIRLLQEQNLFPKKLNNADDAPELRGIALLTGLSFENQIKGGKGAAIKVSQLLNDYERSKLTPQQAKPKLDDLNAVANVARLLNVESVIIRIDQLYKDINKILGN